ncbi:hypothetical protein HMPREF1580_00915, partial [Gardnerella vaginalis JCP8070]
RANDISAFCCSTRRKSLQKAELFSRKCCSKCRLEQQKASAN